MEIPLPKILFLGLDMAAFYRNNFFNTNDLANLANNYKKELVRLRSDKKEYKYFDDTLFGGLRGNFSTLLTWKGLVKRKSLIVNFYSLGRDKRLINAICNKEIILNTETFTAHTKNPELEKLLKNEAWLFNVRESQAHIKVKLLKDKELKSMLDRDNINFPKESVVKTIKKQYFIRSLVNNFIDSESNVLQFNLINLWSGKKFKTKNIHPLIVLPDENNPWKEIYALKNEDLINTKPILLNINLKTKQCYDNKGNAYQLYDLLDAISLFSKENDNIETRLNYNWDELKKQYCEEETDEVIKKESEFYDFLSLFLKWQRTFFIDNLLVKDVISLGSSGPDVKLIFENGHEQKLELEHLWENYIRHKHQENSAFKNVWLFASEEFNTKKVFQVFQKQKSIHNERIPNTFLSVKNGERHFHEINWKETSISTRKIKFLND